MKVHEIIGEQQLDEINLRHAAAGAIASAALIGAPHKAQAPTPSPQQQQQLTQFQPTAKKIEQPPKPELSAAEQKVVDQITSRCDADPDFVIQVIQLVKKYQKPGFPTAHDLLAIIAVESDFDPDAVSGLRNDPAVGLMQVRPGEWGMDPEDLKDPETAIRTGAEILHKYYRHLHHDKAAAVQAYNVGLTAHRRGEDNPNYLMKYLQRKKNISPI